MTPLNNPKIKYLTSEMEVLISMLLEMRLTELRLADENPDIIALYELTLKRIKG